MFGVFESLSEQFNFPVDRVRYLVLFFLSFPLAIILRSVLHYSYTSSTIRHSYSIIFGVLFGWICFDWQVLYLIGFVSIGYLLLLTLPPQIVHKYSMIYVLLAVSVAHIYRMVTDYGGYTLDFTGPLMLVVQRVSYVAFAYHDGVARDDKDLIEDQRNLKIVAPPSLLEYFSYNFNFMTVMAGPTAPYKEYDNFITGKNITSTEKRVVVEPSPVWPSLKKLIIGIVFLVIYICNSNRLELNLILDTELSFIRRFINITLFCFITRCQYYFIFMTAEAISNAGGLGFNGFTEDGEEKWDSVKIIDIKEFEIGNNPRAVITAWNICTATWVKRVSYDRGWSVLWTNMLSAMWHGFYPGYYLAFVITALGTISGRKLRRLLWHRFQSPRYVKMIYDIMTTTITFIFRDFCQLTFWLLLWDHIFNTWKFYCFIPFISMALVVLVLPNKSSKRE